MQAKKHCVEPVALDLAGIYEVENWQGTKLGTAQPSANKRCLNIYLKIFLSRYFCELAENIRALASNVDAVKRRR